MRSVISNTSCLIALTNIGKLEILRKLYDVIIITPEVYSEFAESIPEWIHIVPPSDPLKVRLIQGTLDLGESSSIALAMETADSLLILDDGKARRYAQSMGLMLTGTLGVTAKASQLGLIEEDMASIIASFQKCGFRIPRGIEELFSTK